MKTDKMTMRIVQFLCSVKNEQPVPCVERTVKAATWAGFIVRRDSQPDPALANGWALTPLGVRSYVGWLREHYPNGGHADLA